MKVLYYNWVDYLDPEGRGGGVSVYQRNLMRGWASTEASTEADTDVGADVGAISGAAVGPRTGGKTGHRTTGPGRVEAWFLSAGIAYDLGGGRPRWARVAHGPAENRARRFEIVNSGTLAFAHHSFGAPEQVSHPATVAAFADFLTAHGPFDAVHFQNLEGLPAEVLALRDRFPGTRFILSLHNYYPFCAQVNLWFQERAHCTDYDAGRCCTVCLPHRHDPRLVRQAHALAFTLKRLGVRPGTRTFDGVFRPAIRLAGRIAGRIAGRGARVVGRMRRRAAPQADAPRVPPGTLQPLRVGQGTDFAARRAAFVGLINAHCDRVLCVSDRVREIAAGFGIAPARLITQRIGTAQAARFATTAPRPEILRPDGTLGLGYLGYMRADKGFFFLLDALEALPAALAARLHLVVAAPATDPAGPGRLRALSGRLASVAHADGYDHTTLDAVLQGVDVGVVPVLWEDNLPQVAIEMHARHIPLLTSDRGGARELSGCDAMVFRAGDTAGFADRIAALLDGRVTAADYWAGPVRAPVGMAEHLAALRAVYAGQDGTTQDGAGAAG